MKQRITVKDFTLSIFRFGETIKKWSFFDQLDNDCCCEFRLVLDLTHLGPMFLFYTPCFQGDKMGTLVLDGLKKLHYPLFYFQYPVRPASLTYDNAPHLATRMKPVQQKVL